jgi:two-component system response regulator GlrR
METLRPATMRDCSGNNATDADAAEGLDAFGMVGRSPAFRGMVGQIRRIAACPSSAPLLIEGDTGTGKELAARAVHYLGPRRDRPFAPLNCGALPENLIESELFGHARGAYTDARQARPGLIAQAEGGTLFLDEIDALSPKAQVSLLRFLQDYRYRPVGQDGERGGDVRVIAASNRPLAALVGGGSFREDLLYRLNVLSVRLPRLVERDGDAVLIAGHFLRRYGRQYGRDGLRFHPSTLEWVARHTWPGNVRELENLVHRLVLLADGPEIRHPAAADPAAARAPSAAVGYPDFRIAKAQAIRDFEHDYLVDLLAHAGGNVSAAARLAHKERRALGRLLKKHGLDRTRD